MSSVLSPSQIAASLTELWSPRIVGEVDDVYIKVAKVHGSITWHAHEEEDELFLILKGSLLIEVENGNARSAFESRGFRLSGLISKDSTGSSGASTSAGW
jgi:hypothetical protein